MKNSEKQISPNERLVILPDEVYESGLKPSEFRVFCHLVYLNQEGLPLSLKRSCEITLMGQDAFKSALVRLEEVGFVKRTQDKWTPEEIKQFTISKKKADEKCEWCGSMVHTLQKHHFPVSAKDGGKDIVEICGSCHADFHHLEIYNQGNFNISVGGNL